MSLSVVPAVSGTSVFRQKVKYQLPVHPSVSMVGLDAGVAKLATLSDGTIFDPVNSFQKNQKTLARLQRQLSRKVKFSNNWQKQKRQNTATVFTRIANIRRDYLHKVTTTVSESHRNDSTIEDLKVSNMFKVSSGYGQPHRGAMSGQNQVKPFDTQIGLV